MVAWAKNEDAGSWRGTVKLKCAENGVEVKKNELLRAGLLILATATAEQLIAAVSAVETVKTGRPENT